MTLLQKTRNKINERWILYHENGTIEDVVIYGNLNKKRWTRSNVRTKNEGIVDTKINDRVVYKKYQDAWNV